MDVEISCFTLQFNEMHYCLLFYLKPTFSNFVNYMLFQFIFVTVLTCFLFSSNYRISN
jgi:hypothetical protein